MLVNAYYKALAIYAVGSPITVKTTQGSASTSYFSESNCYNVLALRTACTALVAGSSGTGVVIGSGSTPPTTNDYCMENQITTVTGTVGLTKSIGDNQDYASITALLTITNTGSEDITINEIGLQIKTTGNWTYLVERTVLDAPVTIASGGVGQITYSIRMNYPTE